MSTPYRNEIDALKGRKAALEQEVAHVDVLLQDAERRQKRMLDVIQIATPCSAKWDEMLGDERVRFCLSCEKNVYNLSALPRDEAERFVQEHTAANKDVCVRFYQRADGTVMTADCPVGVKRKRRKKLALSIAGAGAMAFGAVAAAAKLVEEPHREVAGGMMMQGAMPPQPLVQPTVVPPIAPPPPPVETAQSVDDAPTEHPTVMGRMVPAEDRNQGHWKAGGIKRPLR